MTAVDGFCPMGCGPNLFLDDEGRVTCSIVECPRPDAAAQVLDDRVSEHLVTFEADGFTVRHPLRERLDDALMTCQLHTHIACLSGPPVQPGLYRALAQGEDEWSWWPMKAS
jgi:hypothetical protein